MSDAWGPRAHPERCDEEWLDDATKAGGQKWADQDRRRTMKTSEQILTWKNIPSKRMPLEELLGTIFGVATLILILAMAGFIAYAKVFRWGTVWERWGW